MQPMRRHGQDSVDESDLDIEPFGAEDEGPVQCGDVNSTDLRVADRVPVHHAPVALRHHGGICAEAYRRRGTVIGRTILCADTIGPDTELERWPKTCASAGPAVHLLELPFKTCPNVSSNVWHVT